MNHRVYRDVLMIRRMRGQTLHHHIGTGRFSENIEFETFFVYANREIDKIDSGTTYFDRKLYAGVKRVNLSLIHI